ncbi:hypothetical protein DAI22_08g129533 [Oryza sativa Japonica Group]|nr:hypothetical protein DAI22_08g129533 [Oryza sativa Japonica Group]
MGSVGSTRTAVEAVIAARERRIGGGGAWTKDRRHGQRGVGGQERRARGTGRSAVGRRRPSPPLPCSACNSRYGDRSGGGDAGDDAGLERPGRGGGLAGFVRRSRVRRSGRRRG